MARYWRHAGILGLACTVCLPVCADELVNAMVDEFFAELARRYRFNLLRTPSVDDHIGHAYFVEEVDVKCPKELLPLALAGTRIQATKAVDFRRADLPRPNPTNNWTSVTISSLIGQGAEARLSAKLPDRAADIGAATKSFRASNAQILVAIRTVPAADYRMAAAKRLKELNISKASEIEPGASGIVVPVAELLVQKFEFSAEMLNARNMSLSAKFLELFKLKVAGEQSQARRWKYDQATNSVLAFKPITLLFDRSVCPS